MATLMDQPSLLTESDLSMERGLPAVEVDRRLVTLAEAHRRLESVVCFYLQEVEERQLYLEYGHSSTVDYARERLGFEDRKTWSLLHMARRLKVLPELKKAFGKGKIPWTKAREAVKAATPETDQQWVEKCLELSNRQLEQEVKQTLPPVKKKTLVLVLEGDMLDTYEQTREACERLAGKTLTDMEVFDLMCAEVLCTFATTPPFGMDNEIDVEDDELADETDAGIDEKEAGGFVRSIAERDGWKCTRPGCSCRTGLQGNHIIPRARGGPDEDWNLHTTCASCHLAITQGRLKVSGRAPNGLTWEGPFGVIEKPLPLSSTRPDGKTSEAAVRKEPLLVREERASYGSGSVPAGSQEVMGLDGRLLDLDGNEVRSDHVITHPAKLARSVGVSPTRVVARAL
jgi:hypothetical protein